MNEREMICRTDPGLVREHNEDDCVCVPESGLCVVADGMGGHACGEVASAIAVEQIPARLRERATLDEAIRAAHRAIRQAPSHGRGRPGMGTTVVAARLDGAGFSLAWVGDSRAYLFDRGRVQQLSRDHSHVQELVEQGELTPAEAARHPLSSVVTRALGAGFDEPTDVDAHHGRLVQGQALLLCSDGLNGELDDDRIASVIAATPDLEQAAENLVRAARDAGGRDNVTVALLRPAG